MSAPLVSVICLAYNHGPYIAEALQSVFQQTHPHVELIVVDDHSNDNSVEIIRQALAGHQDVQMIFLQTNLGNCRAFNRGFEKSRGEFIIDLAGDDILLPDRIEKGLLAFQSVSENAGVNFSDAELIDANGRHIGYHSDRFPHATVPRGDVYREVLSHYFINSPTMMIRRNVLEQLGGYDEALTYEDFDFWVRSSRDFQYCYTPEPLIKRRILGTSMGRRQYKRGSEQLHSTLLVCEKARLLNRTKEEDRALKRRVLHEMKSTLWLGETAIAWQYWKLYRRIT